MAAEQLRDNLNSGVRAYYRDGKGPGRCSFGTAMNTWSVFTTACKQMEKAERGSGLRLRTDNPALGIASPSPPTKMSRKGAKARKKILWPVELSKLASCERVPRSCTPEDWWMWRATFVVLAYLYVRPLEAKVLTCDAVKFATKRVSVTNAWDDEREQTSDTKTSAGKREVPVPDTLLPLLHALCERAGEGEAFLLPLLSTTSDKNFARKFRRFLEHARVDRKELFEGAGSTREKQITLRQLRDSGITWRVAWGDNLSLVKKHAGHETIAQTEEYSGSTETLVDGDGSWLASLGVPFGPLPACLLPQAPEARRAPPLKGRKGGSMHRALAAPIEGVTRPIEGVTRPIKGVAPPIEGRVRPVPKEGLEPSRPFGRRILSPLRLPFRHFGSYPGMYTSSHGKAIDRLHECRLSPILHADDPPPEVERARLIVRPERTPDHTRSVDRRAGRDAGEGTGSSRVLGRPAPAGRGASRASFGRRHRQGHRSHRGVAPAKPQGSARRADPAEARIAGQGAPATPQGGIPGRAPRQVRREAGDHVRPEGRGPVRRGSGQLRQGLEESTPPSGVEDSGEKEEVIRLLARLRGLW